MVRVAMVLMAASAWAASNDGCERTSTTSDVRLTIELKDGRTKFQVGEIIPLVLRFESASKKDHWADVRTYDRSGRLGVEQYCVDPEGSDPLATYYKTAGGFIGGGFGGIAGLRNDPLLASAELNEWRTLPPGHYRLHGISTRVWRPSDPAKGQRSGETIRSNTVEFEVVPADPEWQKEQLAHAVQILAASQESDEAKGAARTLRFLNTEDSTRELARRFEAMNSQRSGVDLMLGLFGSPHRRVAIDAMRAELSAPDHGITPDFLKTLVDLQMTADPAWDPASVQANAPESAGEFWERRTERARTLTESEAATAAAAVSRKTGRARALTLHGLLAFGAANLELVRSLRPALVAEWANLPVSSQAELLARWQQIGGPEMRPVLRRIVEQPPGADAIRNIALRRLYEIDPEEGRTRILRDLLDSKAQPGIELLKLLPKEDAATAVAPAAARIRQKQARDVDWELIDRYAGSEVLSTVQPAFEESVGKWACAPQRAMLRYFLRVDPAYGAQQVRTSLSARKFTGCYVTLLDELGDQLPNVQQSAIEALDDPHDELARNAARALGRWGTADAEAPLWDHLRRGGTTELQRVLVSAIGQGTAWIARPDKLAELAKLATAEERSQIENLIRQWQAGRPRVEGWYQQDSPVFTLLQYQALTEEQMRSKLAQFPRGTEIEFHHLDARQTGEDIFAGLREAAAKSGMILRAVRQ